jgi:simple sugar transport system ATP-binding protein
LCDRATVLRAGRVAGTADPRTKTAQSLAELMIGGDLPTCTLAPRAPGDVLMAVANLDLATSDPFGTALRGISLELRAGEIVGLAGISGNGQQELLQALSGERLAPQPAAIRLLGHDAGRLDAAARRRLGLGFVPEERLGRGAVPALSLADNALLTGYLNPAAGMTRRGVIRRGAVRAFAAAVIERFRVKCGGEQSVAASLSGGNLQKFIVGREIRLAPKVMVVAQPTWGVDVGAAMSIRQAIIDLRDAGVAVLVVSEELDELFMMCDRIAVLARGRLSPAVATGATSVDRIGRWMGGDFDEASPTIVSHEGVNHVPA